MARFNWKAYEQLLTKLAFNAIAGVLKDHPDESFYAAAFHAFYAESEGMIALPLLAANSAEAIDEGYTGWGPPNWYWDEISFENDKLADLQGALEEEACRADVDHWQKTHSRFMDAMVKVSKALTSKLKTRKQASKDFVVIVSDEESGDADALLQRCMSKAKYKKLFPVEDDSEDEQLMANAAPAKPAWKPFLADLEEHDHEIVEMGEAALPMLLHAMNLASQRSAAAGILGWLRIADPTVIEVLRRGAATGKDSLYKCAVSLAILGDFDFLFELSNNSKTREIARSGISGLYRYPVESCAEYLPLDFRPLEQYFDNKYKPAIKDLWAGCRSINAEDMTEAFRGLESPHAEIRILAAIMLSRSKALRRRGKTILPVLVNQLSDPNAAVRRRTLQAIMDWGKMAKPHLKEVRKLTKDPNEMVSYIASICVKNIKG